MRLLAILCTSIFFFSCTNHDLVKHKHEISNTIDIAHLILNYPEIKNILNEYKGDTIFIVRNEVLSNIERLSLETNKPVKYIKKPLGYPKSGTFDYHKLLVSFELLKIDGDTAECSIFIKTIGLLGTFKFIRKKDVWVISGYSKNMI